MNYFAKKLIAAGVFTLGCANAHALMIDTFDGTGPIDLSAPQTNTAVGNSTGGFARLLTSITSGTDTNVQIDTATNPGVYAHSQDSGVTGYSQIDYALGGVDLTESGSQNAFRIELAGADLSGLFGVIVDGVSVSLNTTDIIFGTGPSFPPGFGDFVFSDFSGVDFSDVQQVSVFIDGQGTSALDASIDSIGTTCTDLTSSGVSSPNNVGVCEPTDMPSPGPLALIAAGLFGLVGIRHYKKDRSA